MIWAPRSLLLLSFVLVPLISPTEVVAQNTYYVNGTDGNDTWNGLCEIWNGQSCGPKLTIQAGINASTDGDTVVIADGVYSGSGNRNMSFGGRAITVRSLSGPEGCIVDCQQLGRGFYFFSDETADSVLTGITIMNGLVEHRGGGIRCDTGSPTISNCRITGCEAGFRGGGIYCDDGSSPTLRNCMFLGNTVEYRGGGVSCDHSSDPILENCVIADNYADYNGSGVYLDHASRPIFVNCTITKNRGGGLGLHANNDSGVTIVNSIIWGNESAAMVVATEPLAIVSYSDIAGGWIGVGNFSIDPLLVDPGKGDYHLSPSSPCISVGDDDTPFLPLEDFEGQLRIQHCRVDVGADETDYFLDCNENGTHDACDIAAGSVENCTDNGVPDSCEPDCNTNGVADSCDTAQGTSDDCNSNTIPDECEPDCNSNFVPDECDITSGFSQDCNLNAVPDECDPDCEGVGVPDDCRNPDVLGRGSRYLEILPQPLCSANPVLISLASPSHSCVEKFVDVADGWGVLVDSPVMRLPADWGIVRLSGIEIVPGALYDVRLGNGSADSDPVGVATNVFGDVDGDGIANLADAFLIVTCFQQGDPSLIPESDIAPCEPNHICNLEDVLWVVLAFQGVEYPYLCGPVCPTP